MTAPGWRVQGFRLVDDEMGQRVQGGTQTAADMQATNPAGPSAGGIIARAEPTTNASGIIVQAARGVDTPRQSPTSRLRLLLAGVVLLAAGIGIRAAIIVRPELGHLADTDFFVSWTRSMTEQGLGGFYQSTRFCDYPPLFLLTMWGIGHAVSWGDPTLAHEQLLRAALKAPACLADLLIALALLWEGRRWFGGRRALGASALYFLNPVSVYNSAYWGQVDAIHTLFILLGIIGAGRRRWGLAGGAMGLALLQKFQSIAFVPLLILEAYHVRRWRGVFTVLAGAVVVAAAVLAPFARQGILEKVVSRAYIGVVGQYTELSPSAFNVWSMLGMAEVSDTVTPRALVLAAADGRVSFPADASPLLWFTWRRISLIGYSLVVALILSFYSYRPGPVERMWAAGLLGLAFFLFPSEMHERYVHPVIALLALWAVSGAWRERTFVLLSGLILLNLTHIQPVGAIGPYIGAAFATLFAVLLIGPMLLGRSPSAEAGRYDTVPPIDPPRSPSQLVSWFRRTTYTAVVSVTAGGVAMGYIAVREAREPDSAGLRYLRASEIASVSQGWGVIRQDASVLGGAIRLGDTIYLRGLGTHARSALVFDIPAGVTTFAALVGIDAETGKTGTAVAGVDLDGNRVFESPRLTGGSEPVEVRVDLNGAKRLTLRADPTPDGQQSDHVDWALARFE